jgi:hypothetical protein
MRMIPLAAFMLLFATGSHGGRAQPPENARRGPALTVPPFGGRVMRFTSPQDGQVVAAGDTVDVVIETEDGAPLESAFVVFAGGALVLRPPFHGHLPIREEWVGPVELLAAGKTTSGLLVDSRKLTLQVIVRDADVVALMAPPDGMRLAGPGSTRSLSITGKYSDGIERDLTEFQTSYSFVTGSDVACITEGRVIVGRSPGLATVLVRHGSLQETLEITVGDERQPNNLPHAVLEDSYEAAVGDTLCLSAARCWDPDDCLGERLGNEAFQWKLLLDDTVSRSVEGVGFEFCIAAEKPGTGLIYLTVTDAHGGSSETIATVIIE